MSESQAFDRGDEVDLPGAAQENASARELIHRALLRQLLHGKLRPTEDAPESENSVAEEHDGWTRMPVRMALAVLAGEGLIQQRARHGFWVVEYRPEDIRYILAMRADVEARIVGDLADEDRAADDGAWGNVTTAYRRMTGFTALDDPEDSFGDLDTQFHVALAAAGDFQIAARHIEEWSNQTRLFEVQHGADDSGWPADEMIARHADLLEAINAGEADAAIGHVREEFDQARRRIEGLAGEPGPDRDREEEQVILRPRRAKFDAEATSVERPEPMGA